MRCYVTSFTCLTGKCMVNYSLKKLKVRTISQVILKVRTISHQMCIYSDFLCVCFNITSKVPKFVDGTKVFRMVKHDGDTQYLQDDLNKLVKWE